MWKDLRFCLPLSIVFNYLIVLDSLWSLLMSNLNHCALTVALVDERLDEAKWCFRSNLLVHRCGLCLCIAVVIACGAQTLRPVSV